MYASRETFATIDAAATAAEFASAFGRPTCGGQPSSSGKWSLITYSGIGDSFFTARRSAARFDTPEPLVVDVLRVDDDVGHGDGHPPDVGRARLALLGGEHLRVAQLGRDAFGVEQDGRTDQRPGEGAAADLVHTGDEAEALAAEDVLEPSGELLLGGGGGAAFFFLRLAGFRLRAARRRRTLRHPRESTAGAAVDRPRRPVAERSAERLQRTTGRRSASGARSGRTPSR